MESQSQGSSERLDDLYVAFARPLLAQLEQWEAAGNVPQFPSAVYVPERGPLTRFETRYKYRMLLQKYFWTSFPNMEADRCVRALWDAGVLRYPESKLQPDDFLFIQTTNQPSVQVALELTRELMLPIFDLLNRYKTYQLTDEQLLERFTYFQDLWRSPVVHWEVTFPLVNFDSNLQQEYPIGSRLRLAPLTKDEQDDIWHEAAFSIPRKLYELDITLLANVRFKLVGSFSQMKDVIPDGPSVNEVRSTNQQEVDELLGELEQTLLAFHLFKEGEVGTPAVFEKSEASSENLPSVWQVDPTIGILPDQHVRRSSWLTVSRYILEESDLPVVKTLFEALQTLHPPQDTVSKPYGDLTVALRRFKQAYARDLPEDQIIDQIIALESTLLAHVRGRLKYTLTHRGATLLVDAETPWEQSKSLLLLRTMYETRSSIVHDGQQLIDLERNLARLQDVGIPSQLFLQQSEDIVRAILRAYVRRRAQGQTVNQVNQELDRRIAESPSSSQDTET